MKEITTRTGKIVLDVSGVIIFTMLKDSYMELDDARENLGAIKQLGQGKLVPVLMDLRETKGGSKECRDYLGGEEAAEIQSACAMLVASPLSRLIGNFFLGLNMTRFPARIFTSENEAIEWLKTFLSMEQQFNNELMNEIIEMISSMSKLDFSKRVETKITNDPSNIIAYGLNMLSEELESNVVKKSAQGDKEDPEGSTGEDLKEINKNLETFSYTVAHDMKAPLNSSVGLIHLIEHELKENENPKIREYVQLLKEINQRTINMIAGTLEYSKLNFKNIMMGEIDLGKICSEIAREYSQNKSVVITIGDTMPKVMHNETAIRQVISNLLSNAVKHNDKDLCLIEIQANETEDYFNISVSDNGPGIRDENKEKIFGLFEGFSTQAADSTGIGLATVKKIVTETGGKIWVESENQRGSTFIFSIRKEKKSLETLKV